MRRRLNFRILVDSNSIDNADNPIYSLQLRSSFYWKDAGHFHKRFSVPTSYTNLENIKKAIEELLSNEIQLINLTRSKKHKETVYDKGDSANFRIVIFPFTPEHLAYSQHYFLSPHILQIRKSNQKSFSNWMTLAFMSIIFLYLAVYEATNIPSVFYLLFMGILAIKAYTYKATWETVEPYNLSHGSFKDVQAFCKDFINPPEYKKKKSNICENCKYYQS